MNAPIQALAEQVVGPDKLVQIVRPFVGTGCAVHRGVSAIDVRHTLNSVDADVRKVDASGLELVRDGFAQVVPWASVRSITVRGLDAEGETTSAVTYVNACARLPLHSNRSIAA